jgi:hypothetical protein
MLEYFSFLFPIIFLFLEFGLGGMFVQMDTGTRHKASIPGFLIAHERHFGRMLVSE